MVAAIRRACKRRYGMGRGRTEWTGVEGKE